MTAVHTVTFDNLGEVAELARGEFPAGEALGRHFSATRALPRILAALEETGLHATFFVEGRNTELYPERLAAIAAAGHEVAYHGWCHEPWGGLDPAEEAELLARGVRGLEALGLRPLGFRPPGGELNPESLRLLREHGFAYCSPAGDEGSALRDDTPRDGVAIVPFAWPLVDAYHYLPRFAGLRGSDEPNAPGEFERVLAAALDRGVGGGGHSTVVFHPFLTEPVERFAVLRNHLAAVRSLVDAGELRCVPYRDSRSLPSVLPLIPTTLVGSYPQPDWLIDRERLLSNLPPRVRARELWRVPEAYLAEAQDDATSLAIRDFERAGLDILTDGEIRRESYSNRFATALEGMDIDHPAMVAGRTGKENPVPRIVGPIRRTRPVEVDDLRFLRASTDCPVKITLPGPFTMSRQAANEAYDDPAELAMDLAIAVNEEIRDLFAAGADVVQIDEPWLQARVEDARAYAVAAINRAVEGAEGTTALHTCFGYAHVVTEKPPGYSFFAELNDCAVDQIAIESAQPRLDLSILREINDKTIILGVLDLSDDAPPETAEQVAARIEAALEFIEPERLQVAPDCGMKYLPRDVAFAKLRALVEGAAQVRARLA